MLRRALDIGWVNQSWKTQSFTDTRRPGFTGGHLDSVEMRDTQRAAP